MSNIAVKRAKTGLGLFASIEIPSETEIIEYKGKIIPIEEALSSSGKYFFDIENGYAIDGSSRKNLARYINHSCKPNAEAIIDGERIFIWSKKIIRAGEEITIDYGEDYFNEYIAPKGCMCEKCAAGKRGK